MSRSNGRTRADGRRGPVAAWSAECFVFCVAREASISDNESAIAAQDAATRERAAATADSTSSCSMRRCLTAALGRAPRTKLLIEQQRISNAVSAGSSRCGISM
ncbi:hypothetical protein [Burkholderia ambifaria]|uniref:hypothetical protein n=1 Tax=Burkholderia ambifaria TaxID=152480 RepID=UPI00158E443E|nr:hypothetical protein [Burkholderia ambifaria]